MRRGPPEPRKTSAGCGSYSATSRVPIDQLRRRTDSSRRGRKSSSVGAEVRRGEAGRRAPRAPGGRPVPEGGGPRFVPPPHADPPPPPPPPAAAPPPPPPPAPAPTRSP